MELWQLLSHSETVHSVPNCSPSCSSTVLHWVQEDAPTTREGSRWRIRLRQLSGHSDNCWLRVLSLGVQEDTLTTRWRVMLEDQAPTTVRSLTYNYRLCVLTLTPSKYKKTLRLLGEGSPRGKLDNCQVTLTTVHFVPQLLFLMLSNCSPRSTRRRSDYSVKGHTEGSCSDNFQVTAQLSTLCPNSHSLGVQKDAPTTQWRIT